MQRYSDFRPTAFDARGLNGEKHGIAEWFVAPVSQTRDSGPLDLSNFRSTLAALGGESDTVQVHRFGHWGPGWFEIIVIDPADEARVTVAQTIERKLDDYPVVSDDDFSALEWERARDYWQRASVRERVQWCQRYDVCVFAARHDNVPEDRRGELISALAE